MKGMNGLSRRATIKKIEDEIRLSVGGVAVHCSLFGLCFFFFPEIRSSPVVLLSIGLMVVFAFSQASIILKNKKWLRASYGIKLWRVWTTINTQLAVGAWSLTACYSFWNSNTSPTSILLLIVLAGFAGVGGTSLAFDQRNFILYELILLLPLTAVLLIKSSYVLAAGLLFALIYSIYNGQQLHRLTVTVIQKSEQTLLNLSNLEAAYNLIKAMHSNINESFIILNYDGLCKGEISDVSRNFFPKINESMPFWEFLELDPKSTEKTKAWYRLLFSDRLSFDDIEAFGPRELELKNKQLYLKLKFHALRDSNRKLIFIILTATDISSEIKSQKALAHEKERAALILRIHQARPAFRIFLIQLESAIETVRTMTAEKSWESLKRDLHTLKGGALLFGAESLSKKIHQTELAIGSDPAIVFENIQTHGGEFIESCQQWLKQENQLFTQLGVFEEEKIVISKSKLAQIEAELKKTGDVGLNFNMMKAKLLAFEFGELLADFSFHVDKMSARLGKQVSFNVEQPPMAVSVDPAFYRGTLSALIHLFNNCLDHGLESAEERVLVGKPSEGKITVRYRRATDQQKSVIRLEIEDDGRGINIPKIREKLKRLGKANVDQMSDLEVANSIFRNMVSSRDAITEISGQGIGMGAVRQEILKVRGKIAITKTDANGTKFEITLPDVPSNEVASP